jgi:hypothetical protein
MAGRLLLKANGIISEAWCPLDPEPLYEPPPQWNGLHVSYRYAEAFSTLIRMPLGGFGPRWFGGCWPAYRSEWEDLLAMLDDGGDALRQVQEHRNQVRIPPSSIEISCMDRALGWPSAYLRGSDPDLCRAFNIVSFATAREVSVDDVVQRGKHAGVRSPTEWHRLALEAADQVAAGLRADRQPVF